MEEHPPLFSDAELKGLPTTPEVEHPNVTPLIINVGTPPKLEVPPTPLTPVFNPVEMVMQAPPEKTEITFNDAKKMYKELVGFDPEPEYTEEYVRRVISSLDNIEMEGDRRRNVERLEHVEELKEQSKRW
jgi:hypothetical protein